MTQIRPDAIELPPTESVLFRWPVLENLIPPDNAWALESWHSRSIDGRLSDTWE